MRTLFLGLGIVCILYGSLYLLGFLPISVWEYLLDQFIDREPNTFYKIVPTEGADYQAEVAFVVGFIFMVLSKVFLKKEP